MAWVLCGLTPGLEFHSPQGSRLALFGSAKAFAEPLIWKATKGPATVYLYGSVHLLKPGVAWQTPKFHKAFDHSDELWLEIDDLDDPHLAENLIAQEGYDRNRPLKTLLDPAHFEKLTHILQQAGLPLPVFQFARPWLMAIHLSLMPLEKAGYEARAGVDIVIKHMAQRRNTPVKAFETSKEQISYLSKLPDTEAIGMLNEAIDDFSETLKDLDQTEKAWESGDEGRLSRLVRKDMTPSLYQILIVARNQRFARTIAQRLQQSGTAPITLFVTVGAGHLVGEDSLQADLARIGFVVVKP